MAKRDELPGFREKRKILFSEKTSPEKMRQAGEQFMAAERYDEALEFFQRVNAGESTRKIASAAMERGNVPLYMRAKKVLREDVSEQEWLQLAANAKRAELWSAAYLALTRAGREDEAAEVRRRIPGFDAEEPEQVAQEVPNAALPAGDGDES